jgi:hypothetical protein
LVYDRYYRKIMKTLKKLPIEGLTVLEIPDDFVVAENYLFDCVHLSHKGHIELEAIIRKSL